jgi:2'-5' RNA ligase
MRLFVAVDVGEAVRREVTRVVGALSAQLEAAKKPPKVAWVKPAALHITVRFIGEVDQSEADRLQSWLAPPIEIEPFTLEWRGIGTFPSRRHPRALWLGVIDGGGALAAVEAEVSRRLAGDKRVDIGEQAFLPHLTIGRVKMAGEGIDWPKLLQGVEVTRVRSLVDRVTLYRSELSQFGPNYTGLVSAPLVGRTNSE